MLVPVSLLSRRKLTFKKQQQRMASGDIQKVLDEIDKQNIQIVRFELSDMYAISHSKSIAARHFKSKAEYGVPFIMRHLGMDPQACKLQGTGYGEEVKYCDALYFPDLDTYQIVPWLDRTARILLRATYKGNLLEGYPRNIAERQLKELRNLGYSLLSAHEHEFFVTNRQTKRPVTDGIQLRATIRMGDNQKFIDQIRDQLPLMGVDLECFETEYAPGQFEITYKPAFGIRSADNASTYKTGIKEIARIHGLNATFMSKPYEEYSGSGGHFNHSLWNVDGTKSVMYDIDSPNGLSKVAEYWIAGLLYHAPALTALLSPTVNCIARLRNNTFIPTYATWGFDNRTLNLRIKGDLDRIYIENRMSSAAVCPYTSLAVIVAAGIDGIKNKYQLPPECNSIARPDDNVTAKSVRLPGSMEEAIKCLLGDDVIRGALGEAFIKCFVTLKNHEQKLRDDALSNGKNEFEWAREYYSEYI